MFDIYILLPLKDSRREGVFYFCAFSCSESLREIESHSHITRFLKNAADTVFFYRSHVRIELEKPNSFLISKLPSTRLRKNARNKLLFFC